MSHGRRVALAQRGRREGGLDFHTPYGCSRGAADQYVLDYARGFAPPTVVLRMGCLHLMGGGIKDARPQPLAVLEDAWPG